LAELADVARLHPLSVIQHSILRLVVHPALVALPAAFSHQPTRSLQLLHRPVDNVFAASVTKLARHRATVEQELILPAVRQT
jgi:hypothetical protein